MNKKTYPNKRLRRYLLIPVFIAVLIFPQTAAINKIISLLIISIFILDAAINIRSNSSNKVKTCATLELLIGLLLSLWIISK